MIIKSYKKYVKMFMWIKNGIGIGFLFKENNMDVCVLFDSFVLKFLIFIIFGFINYLKIILNIVKYCKNFF